MLALPAVRRRVASGALPTQMLVIFSHGGDVVIDAARADGDALDRRRGIRVCTAAARRIPRCEVTRCAGRLTTATTVLQPAYS